MPKEIITRLLVLPLMLENLRVHLLSIIKTFGLEK